MLSNLSKVGRLGSAGWFILGMSNEAAAIIWRLLMWRPNFLSHRPGVSCGVGGTAVDWWGISLSLSTQLLCVTGLSFFTVYWSQDTHTSFLEAIEEAIYKNQDTRWKKILWPSLETHKICLLPYIIGYKQVVGLVKFQVKRITEWTLKGKVPWEVMFGD